MEMIKRDFMLKRSQLKGKFIRNINYKSRWFILEKQVLRYHDGSLATGEGKEKGRIFLNTVRAVEKVDEQVLDNKPNAFQVQYRDAGTDEPLTLYIFAMHSMQRDEWITAIRNACEKSGAVFGEKYHLGIWDTRSLRYTCCDNIRKDVEGCEPVTWKPTQLSSNTPTTAHHTAAQNGASSPAPTAPGPSRATPRPPRIGSKPKKKVIALYDYEKGETSDLSISKGEVYEVLDDSRAFWWLAVNKEGEEGYIPSNYVEETTDQGLEDFDWFYPSTTRGQSEEILKNEKREGCFLVRNASAPGMYTLSIYTQEVPEGVVRHYHIKLTAQKKYYLSDKHAFSTIPELIHYHKHNSAGLIVRLRSPPADRNSNHPTTAGLGHDLFEIDRSQLELREELGRGQFGTVRLARFQGKKDVAVKEMKEGTMSEDDFIEEARTMTQLKHNNLVQLYGVCTKSRPIYIVCEFMKYGALLQYLRRRKASLLKQPARLIRMSTEVCSAMKYLEESNFIHRDLAARNCLVSEHLTVKVGDFGLARFVIDDQYTCSTGTKFPIKWAPPEVLQYTKFSSKSDVWAFGVLMWEIWTGGETPYSQLRNTEVINMVVNQNYRLEQPKDCPDIMYAKMQEMWKKKPEDRPSFAQLDVFYRTQDDGYVQ